MNTRTTSPLYPWAPFYFLLLLATAFFGFWPSYFSRLPQMDLAHHFHGITATAWMLLLIAQAWLMRQRNYRVHRMLGRTSLVLAPLFVASGLILIHGMVAHSNPFTAQFGDRLAFVDFTTIGWFAIAYALAIHHRRETPLHARYLASTAILVLPPALARALPPLVPAITSFEAAFHVTYVLTEAIVLALIVHDLRGGKLRAPYPILLGLTLLQHVSFVLLPGMPWWRDFCTWYGAL